MERKEILENAKNPNCKYNLEESKRRLVFWCKELIMLSEEKSVGEEPHMKNWRETIKDNIDYFFYLVVENGCRENIDFAKKWVCEAAGVKNDSM